MVDLTRDLARVAHVPGVLRRRALMVGTSDDRATRHLFRDEAHAAVVADASVLIHDIAALRTADEDQLKPLRAALSDLTSVSTPGAMPSERLVDQADVFTTAAALGDLALLRELLEKTGRHDDESAVNVARLVEVAALNGHHAMVTWLWELKTNKYLRIDKMPLLRHGDAVRQALDTGVRRALDQLSTHSDSGSVTHLRTMLFEEEALVVTEPDGIVASAPHPLTAPPKAEPSTPSTDVVVTASAATTTAALVVLTNRSLLSVVGAFQPSPHVLIDPLIQELMAKKPDTAATPWVLVPRLAIIHGDLDTLKAACLLSKVRVPDLPLLLHFAASEGRFKMVRWLHDQFPDGIQCRPDTMAMAVRCGWSEIVEWLSVHHPESAQSMSYHALSDAARWGHVHVLRVCHTLGLGASHPAVLAKAARSGQLAVVKLLHALDWGYDRTVAMREALTYGHFPIVRWLYTEEAVATGRLVQALCSSAPTADETVRYVWSLLDPTCALVTRCVVDNFVAICERAVETTLPLILPLVPSDSAAAFDGLLAATRAARHDNVKLLLPHWQSRDSSQVDTLLQAALATENVVLIKWFVHQDSVVTPAQLDRLFTRATQKQTTYLDDSARSWGDHGVITGVKLDPSALSTLKEINQRRQQERAQTKAESSGASLEVERALIASVSDVARSKVVDALIERGRPMDAGGTETQLLVTQSNGVVVLAESSDDDDANGALVVRVSKRSSSSALQSPVCGVHAARTGNMSVLKHLHAHALLPPFMVDIVVAVAHTNGQLGVLQWLVSLGESVASERGIRAAMASDRHREIITFLIDLRDDRVDGALHRVVLTELRADAKYAPLQQGRKRKFDHAKVLGWASSLLQLLVQKRPEQHHRLLEIAAEAGAVAAVTYLLGPRAQFDGDTVCWPAALIAAARGQNEAIVRMLHEGKDVSEPINVAALRQLGGLASVGAVETLVMQLCKWDPSVRAQVERERDDATRLFLLPPPTKRATRPRRRTPRTRRQRPRSTTPFLVTHTSTTSTTPTSM